MFTYCSKCQSYCLKDICKNCEYPTHINNSPSKQMQNNNIFCPFCKEYVISKYSPMDNEGCDRYCSYCTHKLYVNRNVIDGNIINTIKQYASIISFDFINNIEYIRNRDLYDNDDKFNEFLKQAYPLVHDVDALGNYDMDEELLKYLEIIKHPQRNIYGVVSCKVALFGVNDEEATKWYKDFHNNLKIDPFKITYTSDNLIKWLEKVL